MYIKIMSRSEKPKLPDWHPIQAELYNSWLMPNETFERPATQQELEEVLEAAEQIERYERRFILLDLAVIKFLADIQNQPVGLQAMIEMIDYAKILDYAEPRHGDPLDSMRGRLSRILNDKLRENGYNIRMVPIFVPGSDSTNTMNQKFAFGVIKRT